MYRVVSGAECGWKGYLLIQRPDGDFERESGTDGELLAWPEHVEDEVKAANAKCAELNARKPAKAVAGSGAQAAEVEQLQAQIRELEAKLEAGATPEEELTPQQKAARTRRANKAKAGG